MSNQGHEFTVLKFLLGLVLLGLVRGKSARFLLDNDQISCNFESGFCGYMQQHNDNYDWSIGQGRTSSGNTGPITDHTSLANGHYAFIDSSEHNAGKKARIISPIFPNPTLDHYRVQFWYDMEGRDIGTLNVYARAHGAALGDPLLSITGDQVDGWHPVCMDIPLEYDRFQIAFEGVGDGNKGDIAIDDVTLSHGSCNISTRNISCDFDKDNCGYIDYSEADLNWRRHQGGTPTTNTGPQTDHTTGNGHYLYVEGNEGDDGDLAAVISPSFETDEHHLSVRFWYHMYGSQMGELSVFYIVGEQQSDDLFYSDGEGSRDWYSACINLPLYTHNVRVVFEAIRGDGTHSDVAIDDVQLQRGFCTESHTPLTTSSTAIPSVAQSTTTAPMPLAQWSRWSSYSTCAATCGSNVIRTSTRMCVGGTNCPGDAMRTTSCGLSDCIGPIDGDWSAWTTWTTCSATCDLGHLSRDRSCDNPAPSSGGLGCQGSNSETKDCSLGPCPSWTHWFEGPCSSSCGNGTRERLRTCSSGHVEDCTGSSYELVPCTGVVCIE